jgi:parvulin-like peptidyl-prolyl isomerase
VLNKVGINEKDLIDYFRKHYEKDGPAPEGTFKKVKRRIEKRLRKAREKELSDNFIAGLREKADIWVNKDLVDLLEPEKNYTGKKSIVARVNGETIPLNDFLHDLKQAVKRRAAMFRLMKDKGQIQKIHKDIKQGTVDSLIRYKMIEQEALRRNYVNDPAFMGMVKKRKERLLVTEFKAKIVYPLSVPTKNELTQYYEKHIDDFRKGYEVRFNEMIFQQREDAENALKELKQGADFEFLAARVSEKWMPRKKAVWVNANSFSPAIREELNRLGVGQTSDVIADSKQYKIIKLKGKKGGDPVEFSGIVDTLKKIVGQKNFNKVLSKYLAKLRDVSTIKINKNALKVIEKNFWKESSGKNKTQVSP